MKLIDSKNFEENKRTAPFLTSAQAHNFDVLDDIGITCESSPAKRELSISDIWQLALFMARQGFKVFPLVEQGKIPLFGGWQEKATNNEDTILKWAKLYRNHNYGVLTGNGWFVLDFDHVEPDRIYAEIQRVQETLGSFELGTLVKTGRGYQLYCNCDGFDIRNSHEKRLTDKVDIKGAGGYVVGPGSIHPNGTRYEFCDVDTLRDGIKLTKLPEAALSYILSLQGSRSTTGGHNDNNLRGANSPESRTRRNALDYAKPIPEGERNDTLFRAGCHYREAYGLPTQDIYPLLKEINNNDCEVPTSDSELRTIAESCGRYAPGAPRSAVVEPLTNEECSNEAQSLFQDNKLIELFRRNVQKFHVGDWNIAELLMLSVTSQSVINSDGIQPKLSGESGKGKTHVSRSVLHLLDPRMYRAASFSSKVLFYDDTLTPQMVIFSDDVSLNEDIEEIVRAAMTNWYEPTQRMTLDSKRNPVTLSLQPRLSFWFTSVKTTSTVQLLNRQVEVNVDESPDQDKRVEEHQRGLSASGMPEFYIDEGVELLRSAFLHLHQIDFKVKIPFEDRIKLIDVSNRRNLPIFFDFIKAYCVLNYTAREMDDDGALIATKEDFDNAVNLFDTVAVQQITKLNQTERKIAAVIVGRPLCDLQEIRAVVGLGQTYVYEIIHGKKNSGNKGLLEKIPELTCYYRNDIDPETGSRWGRNRYELPENWSTVDTNERIVYWKEDSEGSDEDQLRSISHYIAQEERNSEHDAEGLFSRLGGVNSDIVHNTNTNFATSEEYETSAPPGYPVTPQRSCEIEPSASSNESKEGVKPETDAQNTLRSISETRSEGDRSTPEINSTRSSSDAADEPQDLSKIRQLLHDYLVFVKQQGEKPRQDLLRSMVANKVKDLSNGRYSLTTILGYYDRLNSEDAQISAIISSICGGELSVRRPLNP